MATFEGCPHYMQVCAIPPAALSRWHQRAAAPGTPASVSRNDVAVALVWRALCRQRCAERGVGHDSDAETSAVVAVDIRRYCEPRLDPGCCSCFVGHAWTSLPVRDLLSMPVAEVAARVRSSIESVSAEVVASQALWLEAKRQAGSLIKFDFGGSGLVFFIPSWAEKHLGAWTATFGGASPVWFDHTVALPVGAVLAHRPDGGVNVATGGSLEFQEQLRRLLKAEVWPREAAEREPEPADLPSRVQNDDSRDVADAAGGSCSQRRTSPEAMRRLQDAEELD